MCQLLLIFEECKKGRPPTGVSSSCLKNDTSLLWRAGPPWTAHCRTRGYVLSAVISHLLAARRSWFVELLFSFVATIIWLQNISRWNLHLCAQVLQCGRQVNTGYSSSAPLPLCIAHWEHWHRLSSHGFSVLSSPLPLTVLMVASSHNFHYLTAGLLPWQYCPKSHRVFLTLPSKDAL